MVWGCFAANGTGRLQKIDGTMRKEDYLEILQDNLKTSAKDLNLGKNWVFQQDNDPKHTSKVVSDWLKKKKIRVMEWPSQSPDLNPIENLWTVLKKRVRSRKPKKVNELYTFCKEEWANIPGDVCKKLVQSCPKRLRDVKKYGGNATKY